jgi:hypothetical protein
VLQVLVPHFLSLFFVTVHYRDTGQYLVVTANVCASASATQQHQQQLVFSRAGQLQAASEPLPVYGALAVDSASAIAASVVASSAAAAVAPVVAWRPAGNLIAAPQKTAGKHQVNQYSRMHRIRNAFNSNYLELLYSVSISFVYFHCVDSCFASLPMWHSLYSCYVVRARAPHRSSFSSGTVCGTANSRCRRRLFSPPPRAAFKLNTIATRS